MPQGRLLPTCSTISIPRFSSFSRIRAQFHSPRGLSQSKIFSGFTHIQHWIVEFVGRALHLVKHNFLDNCRFSRMKFLCVRRVCDSAGPRGTRSIAPHVVAFRTRGRRPLPDLQISELDTLPTYTPIQRFECDLTTALAWLVAGLVR